MTINKANGKPMSASKIKRPARPARRGKTGVKKRRGLGGKMLRLPKHRRVAVVVCAMNEGTTITRMLNELGRLKLHETIVVINGSSDDTWAKVRRHPSKPIVIHYDEALGHDVGRAIGAKASTADLVLFVDGDLPIRAPRLAAMLRAAGRGTDVVLNHVTPYLPRFHRRDQVTIVKEFLNRACGRADLDANSLTAVPHVLSRRAIERIGPQSLAVPPLAQVRALQLGLKVNAPVGVNVFRTNRKRATNTGKANPVSDLIVADHLEALSYLFREEGHRLGYPDHMRNRLGGRADG